MKRLAMILVPLAALTLFTPTEAVAHGHHRGHYYHDCYGGYGYAPHYYRSYYRGPYYSRSYYDPYYAGPGFGYRGRNFSFWYGY